MTVKNKLFLSYLAAIVLAFSGTQGAIKNIKNTYQILSPGCKHLSIAHGAVAWETGFIRRLYDFGQIFPAYISDPTMPTRKLIDHYDELNDTHMTVRLVHALFYRVPGSTSDADFGISKQLGITDDNAL